jgi:hypothetical protein
MAQKDPTNTGGRTLMKTKGKEYFKEMARARWDKFHEAKNKDKKAKK